MYIIETDRLTCCSLFRSRGEDWRVNIITTADFSLDKDFYYTEETKTAKYIDDVIFSRVYKNKFNRNPVAQSSSSQLESV